MTTCNGTTSDNKPCQLPAGWGTDSDEYCTYHEPVDDSGRDSDADTDTMPQFELPHFDNLDALSQDGSDLGRIGETVYARTPEGYRPVSVATEGETPEEDESGADSGSDADDGEMDEGEDESEATSPEDEDGGDSSDEPDGPPTDSELVITTDGPDAVNYRFVATDAEAVGSAESNDTVTETADGVEVTGWTGANTSDDTWDVTGLSVIEDIGGDEPGVYTLGGVDLAREDFPPTETGGGEDDGEESDEDTGDGTGGALVSSSLDTDAEINDFFVNEKAKYHSEKVEAVSSPAHEGDGAMRINFPGGDLYGAELDHDLREDNLSECHLRYHVRLDSDFEIDNPWSGHQMGKAGIGFDARYGNDLSDQGGADGTNGWLVNMAMWRGDARGAGRDEWFLTPYVYHADQGSNTGDTLWVDDSAAMQRDEWYQIDIYVRMNTGRNSSDGVLRVWNDGQRVLNKTDMNWAWEAPHTTIQGLRGLFYYGGGWGAPDGSGDNHIYVDNIQVFDAEQTP